MDERISALMETMKSLQADTMVRAVRQAVEADPGISGREVLVLLEGLASESQRRATQARADSEPDRDVCAKCGQPVETDSSDRERWVHSSDRSRGCRAATFDPDSGWNDDIPKSWLAVPRRHRS
ncbi:hypothetical protein [Streptomyces sp. NPDC017529]|uniref:hypothetical protein n=1 Tax=Streptomyces sp. NPDC017529 TaxID=3365000 RepID=UPI0037908B4B